MNKILFSVLLSCLTMPALAESIESVSKNELYKHFFNITNKKECKQHTPCRMLRRHLIRDNKNCQMDPEAVETADRHFSASHADQLKIKGSMKYVGVFPAKYAYDAYVDSGEIVIKARMYFSNYKEFSERALDVMRDKFDSASKIWTNNNSYPFPVRFVFEITKDKKKAHIKAKLQKKFTRGPYFSKWSLNWSSTTIAHEFGHVMGMDDEYSNTPFAGALTKCSKSSLMCSSWGGRPQNYHYYLVFRRLLCNK